MTLQKCLAEESDITELLSDWRLSIKDEEIWVDNPPGVYMSDSKFETE